MSITTPKRKERYGFACRDGARSLRAGPGAGGADDSTRPRREASRFPRLRAEAQVRRWGHRGPTAGDERDQAGAGPRAYGWRRDSNASTTCSAWDRRVEPVHRVKACNPCRCRGPALVDLFMDHLELLGGKLL
jgi:hypothetical protein